MNRGLLRALRGVRTGALLLLVTPALAFADGPQATPSIFAPASTPANWTLNLSYFVLAVTSGIFVVVGGLLAYVIVRFRYRPDKHDDREPAQIFGSTQIELGWTVIPILIIVVLFLTTARVIFAIQDAPKPPSALDVVVTGHQFWWEFQYPQYGVITANELHLPLSTAAAPRPDVAGARRVVVKIGSSSLTTPSGGIDGDSGGVSVLQRPDRLALAAKRGLDSVERQLAAAHRNAGR